MTYTINDFDVENRWVIPYNRDLIVRYNLYINIERCAHRKVIKYLYKYIHKGPDCATIVIEDNIVQPNNNEERMYRCVNEIIQFQDSRYISSIEACWRILEFYLQKQYLSVQKLQYHLRGEHFVVFRDTDDVESMINRDGIHDTMFTKWVEANINHPDANEFTYIEFPTEWVSGTQSKNSG